MSNDSRRSLVGRRAVVTGGASGIGAAVVEAFLEEGASVAFIDNNREDADALLGRIGDDKVSYHFCDLRDMDQVAACIKEIGETLGGLDAVVNNAASDERHQFATVSSEKWDALMTVNLKHQYFITQAALPFMQHGGSIINMSSISWRRGATDVPVYAIAKAGVEGLTRMLARELGPQGIRANAILPGMVLTEKQLRLWLDENSKAEGLRNQCLKEHVEPHDIADAVVWLASGASRMVTGQAIVVDGGWI